jgi:CHAT domain-containing protein
VQVGSRGGTPSNWTALPFTAPEVEALGDLFAEATRTTKLTGDAATEAAVVEALEQHTWVHVATHGFFRNEGDPVAWGGRTGVGGGASGLFPGLLSGLVLAGANRESAGSGAGDGLLTAEELTWLDLSGCEMVTLSACETGLGSSRGAEGLVGLRRALHQAGARTVVASLWAVEDEATSQLMTAFYRNLWTHGMPRREALRAAQLELLAANREAGDPRPSTWGAFVLSGEWRGATTDDGR